MSARSGLVSLASGETRQGHDAPGTDTAVSRKGTIGGETVISILAKRSRKSFKQRCDRRNSSESARDQRGAVPEREYNAPRDEARPLSE